jgi:hypothetical protein
MLKPTPTPTRRLPTPALHTLGPRPDATSNQQLPDAHDPAHSASTQLAA